MLYGIFNIFALLTLWEIPAEGASHIKQMVPAGGETLDLAEPPMYKIFHAEPPMYKTFYIEPPVYETFSTDRFTLFLTCSPAERLLGICASARPLTDNAPLTRRSQRKRRAFGPMTTALADGSKVSDNFYLKDAFSLPSSLPALSGEWLSSCQNLGTDGLVFSQKIRLAYIDGYVVITLSNFPGPDCNCIPDSQETSRISQWFKIQETKTLWEYEIKGESPFVDGAFEIDYILIHNPFEPPEFHRDLVKTESEYLYVGLKTTEAEERASRLSTEPYIFSRRLTESVEDYMSREHSCHTETRH